MAGSKAYLDLLDTVRSNIPFDPKPEDRTAAWSTLDDAWRALTTGVGTQELLTLATQAYRIYAVERGISIADVLLTARELHIAKNAGYAGADNRDPWANFRLSTAFGVTPLDGVLVRMSDKYIRITNLRDNPTNERVGESILDTLADLAAYALIAICLIQEAWN